MKRATTNYKVSEQTAAILDLKNDLQSFATDYNGIANHFLATDEVDDHMERLYAQIRGIDNMLNELLTASIAENLGMIENRGELI